MKPSQAKRLQSDCLETLFWLDFCRDTGISFRETVVSHLKQKNGITITSHTVEIRLRRLWAESSKKMGKNPGGPKLSFWDSVLKEGSNVFTLDPEVKAQLTKRLSECRTEVSKSGAADSGPSEDSQNIQTTRKNQELYGLDKLHSSDVQSLRTQWQHPLENPHPRVLETQQAKVQQYLEERPSKDFQFTALEKVWNKELEEALERERKLRANEKRLEAENQHLSTALFESQLARRDPQEYQNYLRVEREWRLNQEVHAMRKFSSFFQITPAPLGPVELDRESLNKAVVELQFELEAIMVGHKMSTPLIVPPQVSNSDLGKLVHSAMAKDIHGMSEAFWLTKWRLEPHAVASALTISALRDWVFMSDFPNFEPDDLKILEATREVVMTLGGWTHLRMLNMAAYSLLIERESFQAMTIPRKATKFANLLSQVLAPLFVEQGSRSDDPLFHTWGERPDVYENRRDRMQKLFRIALQLKALTVLTDEDFEFVVHPLGTSDENGFGGNSLGTASNSQHRSSRQQCWAYARIYTYDGRAESPRDPARDAAVKLRNFVVRDDEARAKCLNSKNIIIPRTSSSPDSSIGRAHMVVTHINEIAGGTEAKLDNSEAVPSLPTTSSEAFRNAPFECHVCGDICQNERLLEIHKAKHRQSPVPYLESQAQDSTQAKIQFKAGRKATIKCDICGLAWPDNRRLANHMRTHKNSSPQVSERRPSIASQATEKSFTRNDQVFTCKQCGEIVSTANGLGAHARWRHEKSISNRATQQRSKQGLANTQIQSSENRSIACPVCSQVCQDKRGLSTHTRLAHRKQTSKSSSNAQTQSNQNFPGNIPVTCRICGHACKNRNGLLTHSRMTHKGDQDIPRGEEESVGGRFKCQLGPKNYSSTFNLQRHRTLDHQIPASSPGCNKSAPERSLLQQCEETESKEVIDSDAEVERSRDCSNIADPELNISLEGALCDGPIIRDDVDPQTERVDAPTRDHLLLPQYETLHPGPSHQIIENHGHVSSEDEPEMSDLLMDNTGLENDRPRLERASHITSTSNPKAKNSREKEIVRSEKHAREEIQRASWSGNPKSNFRKRRAFSVAGFGDTSKELEIRHADKRLRKDRNNGNCHTKDISDNANSQTSLETERHESPGGNSSSDNITVEKEITPSETVVGTGTHPADFSPPTGSLLRVELPGISGFAGRFRSFVGNSSY